MSDSTAFAWTNKPHIMVSLYGTEKTPAALDFLDKASVHMPLFSAGGTGSWLRDNGLAVKLMEEAYGTGAKINHKVVTLDGRLYLGIMADADDEGEVAELETDGALNIGMVVNSFYPFGTDPADFEHGSTMMSQIDIGGPSMARAGVKGGLPVVMDPADYGRVLDELDTLGHVSQQLTWELGNKVFEATSRLDANILKSRLANPPAAV